MAQLREAWGLYTDWTFSVFPAAKSAYAVHSMSRESFSPFRSLRQASGKAESGHSRFQLRTPDLRIETVRESERTTRIERAAVVSRGVRCEGHS